MRGGRQRRDRPRAPTHARGRGASRVHYFFRDAHGRGPRVCCSAVQCIPHPPHEAPHHQIGLLLPRRPAPGPHRPCPFSAGIHSGIVLYYTEDRTIITAGNRATRRSLSRGFLTPVAPRAVPHEYYKGARPDTSERHLTPHSTPSLISSAKADSSQPTGTGRALPSSSRWPWLPSPRSRPPRPSSCCCCCSSRPRRRGSRPPTPLQVRDVVRPSVRVDPVRACVRDWW